jgi:hypothetical protein
MTNLSNFFFFFGINTHISCSQTACLTTEWPCSSGMGATVADLRLGAASDGACFPRAVVSGGFRLCLLCRLLCLLVFSALCCCVSFCFYV